MIFEYNRFITIESYVLIRKNTKKEGKVLKKTGRIIHELLDSNFELPTQFEFLKSYSKKELGLFIAEMYIDRKIDRKLRDFVVERERHPLIFEDEAGIDGGYLFSCANLFVNFLKHYKELEFTEEALASSKFASISGLKFNNGSVSYGVGDIETDDIKVFKEKFHRAMVNHGTNQYLDLKYDEELNVLEVTALSGGANLDANITPACLGLLKTFSDSDKAEDRERLLLEIFNYASWVQNVHMFSNGNVRFAYTLLQALLIKNGFEPCFVKNLGTFFAEVPVLYEDAQKLQDPELQQKAFKKIIDDYYTEGVTYLEEVKKQHLTSRDLNKNTIETKQPVITSVNTLQLSNTETGKEKVDLVRPQSDNISLIPKKNELVI